MSDKIKDHLPIPRNITPDNEQEVCFQAAKKLLESKDPRNEWESGLSGVAAIVAILQHFPETEKEGDRLESEYFGLVGYWELGQELDHDVYEDVEDPYEKYRKETFQLGWEALQKVIREHKEALEKVGFFIGEKKDIRTT